MSHLRVCRIAWSDVRLRFPLFKSPPLIWSPLSGHSFSQTSLVLIHSSDHAAQREITGRMTYPSFKHCDSVPLHCLLHKPRIRNTSCLDEIAAVKPQLKKSTSLKFRTCSWAFLNWSLNRYDKQSNMCKH